MLIGLLAGNTFATGGYTPPAGYTLFSQVLFGVSNSQDFDSGRDDMCPFFNPSPGECQYLTGDGSGSKGDGIYALNSGTSASSAAISLAHVVPAAPGYAILRLAANQPDDEALNNCKIMHAWYGSISGDVQMTTTLANIGTVTAGGQGNTEQVMQQALPGGVGATTGTPANILWYKWTAGRPAAGPFVNRLSVFALGWKLEG